MCRTASASCSSSGSLNATEVAGKAGGGFQLKCTGSLNAKPFRADLHGGPLINLDPDHPYELTAHLTASDIKLDARTSFPKPFDMGQYTVKFEVSGNDLADVYYLTGLALPNTPPYRLSAGVEHRGTLFRMDNLKGKLGSSDIEGMVEVDTSRKRPKFTAKIHSNSLNIVDVAPTLGHPRPAEQRDASLRPAAVAARRAERIRQQSVPGRGSAGGSRARHGRRRDLPGPLGHRAEVADEGSAVSSASE